MESIRDDIGWDFAKTDKEAIEKRCDILLRLLASSRNRLMALMDVILPIEDG